MSYNVVNLVGYPQTDEVRELSLVSKAVRTKYINWLCSKIGVGDSAMAKYLKGQRPTPINARALLNALGIENGASDELSMHVRWELAASTQLGKNLGIPFAYSKMLDKQRANLGELYAIEVAQFLPENVDAAATRPVASQRAHANPSEPPASDDLPTGSRVAKSFDEDEFIALERKRLTDLAMTTPLVGSWAERLVYNLNKYAGASLPVNDKESAVIAFMATVPLGKIDQVFHAIHVTCLDATQSRCSEDILLEWATELVCFAAGRTVKLSEWQVWQADARSKSPDAPVTYVKKISSLVAAMGISRLLGLWLDWSVVKDSSGPLFDLSSYVSTSNPADAMLAALYDEISRAQSGPIRLEARRTVDKKLEPGEIGNLRYWFDWNRLEKKSRGVFLRLPDVYPKSEQALIVAHIADMLNAPVVHSAGDGGDTLIHDDAIRITLGSLQARLEKIFQVLHSSAEEASRTAKPSWAPGSAATSHDPKRWDVFICHASEDKQPFVERLVSALRARGVEAWYDELEVVCEDSLIRKIGEGLSKSSFGVVVLSRAFADKRTWQEAELNSLLAQQIQTGQKRIVPVSLDLDIVEIYREFPFLASMRILRVQDGFDTVVNELVQTIGAKADNHAQPNP